MSPPQVPPQGSEFSLDLITKEHLSLENMRRLTRDQRDDLGDMRRIYREAQKERQRLQIPEWKRSVGAALVNIGTVWLISWVVGLVMGVVFAVSRLLEFFAVWHVFLLLPGGLFLVWGHKLQGKELPSS
jgi:hypothetical protein